MKLHICCGDVYLKGYINIDITGVNITELVDDCNPNETTIDKYYKYEFRQSAPRRFIVDRTMDILRPWDFASGSVDEVVMISAIEHFYRRDAEFIVSEVKRVLAPTGRFIFDFPDIVEDVKRYSNDPEFLMELIYCNHKNQYSIHHWGYTPETVKTLLGDGWSWIEVETIVQHDYPMTGIVATRR